MTYASKHGTTAEIAEKVGQVLHQTGLHIVVLTVNRVRGLVSYKAVVLAVRVYIGLWRKEAVAFLKANEKLLSERSVWLP